MEKTVKVDELEKVNYKCGFGCLRPRVLTGVKYDTDYVNKEVKEYIEKTGESEFDFIIKKKVVETKEPIKEVVNSQADQVGIEAYMRNCVSEGMDPNEMVAHVSEEVNDFTNVPDTLADALNLNEVAKEKFDKLPDDLKGKCGNYQEFVNYMTDKMFEDYVQSKTVKKEDKPNGGNENG